MSFSLCVIWIKNFKMRTKVWKQTGQRSSFIHKLCKKKINFFLEKMYIKLTNETTPK